MSNINDILVDSQIQKGFENLIEGKEKIVAALQSKGQTAASMKDTFSTLALRTKRIKSEESKESMGTMINLAPLTSGTNYVWIQDDDTQIHTDSVISSPIVPDRVDNDGSSNSSRYYRLQFQSLVVNYHNTSYLNKPKVILKYKIENIDHIAQIRIMGYNVDYQQGGGDTSDSYDITDKIKATDEFLDLDLTDYFFPDYQERTDSKYNSVPSVWRDYAEYWNKSTEEESQRLTYEEYCCKNTNQYAYLNYISGYTFNAYFRIFFKSNEAARKYPFYLKADKIFTVS